MPNYDKCNVPDFTADWSGYLLSIQDPLLD